MILYLLLLQCVRSHPVVLVHGIFSTKAELQDTGDWFSSNLNQPSYCVEVGNGRLDSVFKPMNWQLNSLKESIRELNIEGSFHLVGFSQGGLLARAYAETSIQKSVKTLLTFGTPHMGVYYYSDESIYSQKSQNHLSYTNYWKDPYMFPLYLHNSSFLPLLNGEVGVLNLADKVDDFVLVWSPRDEVIVPVESAKYEFYRENSEIIIPFEESETFKNNYIGLRKMFEEKHVHFVETDCAHRDYKTVHCLERYKNAILKFLN